MPSLGQNTDELTIISWVAKQGDEISLGDVLLEVETDKATVDVEATVAGTLLGVLYEATAVVLAGAVIAYIGDPSDPLPSVGEAAGPATAAAPGGPVAGSPVTAPPGRRDGTAVLASPAARQLANTHGVDLATLAGSGLGGRVEKSDVIAATSGSPAGIPITRIRATIADRLVRSTQTIPQFTVHATVDMTCAHAAIVSKSLPGLTYTHLLLRAMAGALRQCPELNQVWSDHGPSLISMKGAPVGLAVAGQGSLLVPTVSDADLASLPALVDAVGAVIHRARSGSLAPDDTAPAAITLSNLGGHGVDSVQAIVDPDQTAILATGKVAARPVVRDDILAAAPVMVMSLSCDHRVVDGVGAARFLASVRTLLEREVVD